MKTIWQAVSARLRDRLGQPSFEAWIAPLSFVGIEGRTATFQAANKFFRYFVTERYLSDLRQCFSAHVGAEIEIALVLSAPEDQQAVVKHAPISPRSAVFQSAPRYHRGVAGLTRAIPLTVSWSAPAISSLMPLRGPLPTSRVKNTTRYFSTGLSGWARLTWLLRLDASFLRQSARARLFSPPRKYS
jgi:hypothetical protein